MCENSKISLKDAKEQFTELMRGLDKSNQEQFLSFILREWRPKSMDFNEEDISELIGNKEELVDDPIFLLNSIVSDIKEKVPFEAVLSSESIKPPATGENSDCDPRITLHIDGFLYSDDDVNSLVEDGKLKRYYCLDCGSKNIEPLIFISHSTSRDELYHIFNELLPTLDNKVVLDIGSRLGAILYGAYVYTDAKKIIGVEMNEDLCKIQRDIIDKYKMNDRVEVLHKRIEDAPEIIKQSDVIFVNNAFEFYFSEATQIDIWNFLKTNMRKGTIFVTRPPLETTFSNLETGIVLDEWVKPFECQQSANSLSFLQDAMSDDTDKYSNIACYEIV